MFFALRRRDALGLLAGGIAALSLPRTAAAERDSGPVRATALAENYFLLQGCGANVLLFNGPDGALLVDGGLAEHSAELLHVVSSHSDGRPVRALFNTHWHADRTGLNETLGNQGVKIIAHENTKLWLGTDVNVEWQKKTYQPLPKVALPSETFLSAVYTTRKMNFGGEPVEYGYLPQAHTDGDIFVYFPRPNILMAGDIVSVGEYPILDFSTGGWIGGMSQAAKSLQSIGNAETKIVPGSGPVQTRADLDAEQQMLATVFARLIKLMAKGMSAKDMLAAAPTQEFDARWGSPELLINNAWRGMWGHARELPGSGII